MHGFTIARIPQDDGRIWFLIQTGLMLRASRQRLTACISRIKIALERHRRFGALDQRHVDAFKVLARRVANDRRRIGGALRKRGEEKAGSDADAHPTVCYPERYPEILQLRFVVMILDLSH